jgi:hypothetical protein
MPVPSRIAATAGAFALVLLLSACIAPDPGTDAPTGEPQGPLPPSGTSITLQQLAGVVSEADAPPQALFNVGAASTAGADLASEQDHWLSVGGTPAACADIVSSPYLVSSADAAEAARRDDPTGALATFTEAEDLFGLIQVYGRAFDDAATASGFLDAFSATVAGCSGYRFLGPEGDIIYDASGLRVKESTTAPAGTRVLTYSEEAGESDALGVGITFIQHENAVLSIYSELYPSSTMTPADVAELAAILTDRMAAL